jgi:dipeptidyl aminopeptidase/acylaminoacyl peptidase
MLRTLTLMAVTLLAAALPVEAQQERLTPELLWSFARVSDPQVSPDGRLVVYGVATCDIEANRCPADLYVVSVAGGEPRRVTSLAGSEFNARWRPDGRRIGFLSAESGSTQLWEVNPDGTDARRVTDVEGGIGNFLYSPAGTHVSFTRRVKLDATAGEVHPDMAQTSARIIDNLMYRHWASWHDYRYSHLHVAEYRDGALVGEPRNLMEGQRYDTPLAPFGGVEQIAWSRDGRRIAYTSKKLHGVEAAVSTDSDIYVHDLATGQTTNVSQPNPGYDTEPAFSPDGRSLVWMSMERAGYESDRNRLVLHDFATGQRRELTVGFDRSAEHPTWAPDGSAIYFQAATDGTVQLFAYDLEPARGRPAIRQLTQGQHNHAGFSVAQPARAVPVIVAGRQSMSMPTEIFRVDAATGAATQLTHANRDILARVAMGRVERRMIRATDGQEILTWVIYPPGFDPSRRYPALLYAQGGPQSPVSQFFSYRWNFQIMAANDYIVVAPNRRGTPGLGQAWTDAIAQDWGGQAMRDLLSAIDAVAAEPYVDEARLGAVGASFGGYSVFWLAGHHRNRFRTFIAHAGVFNLEAMYGATEEIFFVHHDLGGPYWREPQPRSYREHSPHLFVDRWDTPMLVIHGELDYRVPVTEGMQAFTALQLKGIPSRLLYYPDEGHWILRPQNGIVWQREFFRWLDAWLKRGERAGQGAGEEAPGALR